MLTKYPPLLVPLKDFENMHDFYATPGDPVSYTGMCTLITPLLADNPKLLKMRPLDSPILVDVSINPSKEKVSLPINKLKFLFYKLLSHFVV